MLVFRIWKLVLVFFGALFSAEGLAESFGSNKKRKLLVCEAQWQDQPPLGFDTQEQARLFAFSVLPYAGSRSKESGTIIYKKKQRYFVGEPNTGTNEMVSYSIGRTKSGKLVTVQGHYPVVEMVHTHPNDGRRGNAWFSASRLTGNSDIATAENLNLKMSMRYKDTLRIYDPKVEDHEDTFGNVRWHKGAVLGEMYCP